MLHWIKSLDGVLKGEATKLPALRAARIELPVGGFTTLLVILGAIYGACMGTSAVVNRWGTAVAASGWVQLGYSALKVPMLFGLTLLITFPSLYVFNALMGSRLTFAAVLRLLLAALGVCLAVLASFGTIVVFFALCTSSYPFMVLLNVLTFAVAGLLGMNFLLQTLHRLAIAQAAAWEPPASSAAPEAPAAQPATAPPAPVAGPQVRPVFFAWVLVFGLVGAQMGWVLRPFIGAPGVPVTFFRPREGNFFQAVAGKIQDLASEPRSSRSSPPTEGHNPSSAPSQ